MTAWNNADDAPRDGTPFIAETFESVADSLPDSLTPSRRDRAVMYSSGRFRFLDGENPEAEPVFLRWRWSQPG